MARPYRDATEVATEPLNRDEWFLTPEGSVLVRGVYFPGMREPLPIVLAPGYEYRIRQSEHDEERFWVIERRATTSPPNGPQQRLDG